MICLIPNYSDYHGFEIITDSTRSTLFSQEYNRQHDFYPSFSEYFFTFIDIYSLSLQIFNLTFSIFPATLPELCVKLKT